MENSEVQDDINLTSTDSQDSPEFREMKMRADAAEAKLRRIYNTPIWRFSKPARKIYARILYSISKSQKNNFIYQPDKNEGLPVVDLVKNKVKIEINNANLENRKIVIIAQYSTQTKITQSLSELIKTFQSNDYSVVLVSACEKTEPLELPKEIKENITILRKPNLGYDFGSWAVALNQFPQLFSTDQLILTNDSLIGPLSDFSPVLTSLSESKFDITGITDNPELQYHVQSYMMRFNQKALRNPNIKSFLNSVVHLSLKNDVILKYELGLTRTAQLSGLFVGALFPWNLLVRPGYNPSLAGWQKLIDLGFPFIKKEALRKANHSEKTKIAKFLAQKFPDNTFAFSEIKELSR